jgi:N-acylneuraminate cytidylyltransferase/CMP-N,N'-diacetyllegionaminic acid synthase
VSNVIGLVTARGGSKGIPRKNIRILAGNMQIDWTIQRFLKRLTQGWGV